MAAHASAAAAASTTDLHVSKRSRQSSASSAARSSHRGKRKVSALKSQISDPTLNHAGSLPLGISFHQPQPLGFEKSPSPESILSPVPATVWTAAPRYQEQDCFDTSVQFAIAPPRLSPMEYARMYMLHRVETRRNGQKCLLPAPQKQWFWTSKWEQFLIIPRIPGIIKRGHWSEEGGCSDESNDSGAQLPRLPDSAASLNPAQRSTGCPRLSLHLGGMTTLMPSVMNLTSLGMSGVVDGPHDLDCSVPRRRSRRHSMSSDGKRTSLTTLTENETWTPSSWDDVPGFFAHSKRQSALHGLCHTSLTARHGLSTCSGHQGHQDVTAMRSNPSSIDEPASQALPFSSASLHPLPLFSGNHSSHSTTHIVSSTVGCRSPRFHDGLAPGRIQSTAASFVDSGDASSGGSYSGLAREDSPGISFPSSHRGSGMDDGPAQRQTTLVTDLTNRSQPCSPKLNDSRRHSLQVLTESVLGQDTQCLTSPSVSSSYIFEDPFLESQHDLASLSSCQQKRPQTPQTPVPDSPTLGQEEVIVTSKPAHRTKDTCIDQISSPPLPTHLTRASGGRKATAVVGYGYGFSSSFALNRAKSHEAFTLLPQLSVSRNCNTRSASAKDRVPHSARDVEDKARARAVLDRTTALALRDPDTASRLASAVVSHHDGHPAGKYDPSVALDNDMPSPGQRKTTFGSLFTKHGRRRSCSKPPSLSEDDSVQTAMQSTEQGQQSCYQPGSLENVSLPPQRHTKQGVDASAESHAKNNTTSSLAGFKEKWKLRKAQARSE
ncbi:hypothetical protein E4U54_002284 [Claviceps lovelessii]|nr:hypothetical protein E4U54_002284 [Claviceps lovelessii]